jgi:two-component system LytT family sensor kinase
MVENHVVVLLLKLGVAASLASIMVRFLAFQRMLMREERTLEQRLKLALGLSATFAAGVGVRVLTKTYRAADLGLEGSLLVGVVGGYVPGLVAGVLISLPAMFNGEYLSMALFSGVGVLGGLLRDCAPDPEEVWRISPLVDLSLYRLFRRWSDRRRSAFHVFFLLAVLFAEFLRFSLSRLFGSHALFALHPDWVDPHPISIVGVYLTTVFCVAVPLKIWNNMRTERKLEARERLLADARLAALTSQINPHFLFNTLNTVSSLIRINPEQARVVVIKLSKILRKLLRQHDTFTPLREELAFIDDYLSIEMVRFGDTLRFVKEVEPESLDRLVPSMLLQPLVENSLKHGLADKVNGGTIRLRSRLSAGRLHLLVEDDGVGIPEAALANLFDQGIGISNVNERLKVIFGNDYKMWIDSKPGEGTRTGIEIPDLQPSMAAAS